jgi:YegS C-terminal NAD kinase beta sandwich-like domain
MTIGPGTAWSVPGTLPPGAPVFSSDRALSEALNDARRNGVSMPVVGLTGGTLWTTVGGPSVVGRLTTTEARHYPVDVGWAEIGGEVHLFVAQVIARTRWRDITAVMNTPFWGRLRLAPRAHPGDALLDLIEAEGLGLDDVRRVLPRARHGAHLPHPKLSERRVSHMSWTFDRPRSVFVDGLRQARVRELSVGLHPDALVVVV